VLDHIGLEVTSYDVSRTFYRTVLASLGYDLVEETHGFCGFGPPGKPLFWIHEREADRSSNAVPVHIAFAATGHAAVDAFHAVAIECGARDNGPPGLREIYHSDYYSAFVFDPDGNNIEAVCHRPE
jgi:catechol 2,3-dioxygenase-like lactoylglutathione lyase family enzyme